MSLKYPVYRPNVQQAQPQQYTPSQTYTRSQTNKGQPSEYWQNQPEQEQLRQARRAYYLQKNYNAEPGSEEDIWRHGYTRRPFVRSNGTPVAQTTVSSRQTKPVGTWQPPADSPLTQYLEQLHKNHEPQRQWIDPSEVYQQWPGASSALRKQPGCSNWRKWKQSNMPACGPAGGSICPNSYPVWDEAHARNALARSRNAPDPEGLQDCVYQVVNENNWFQSTRARRS